ncbi:hypothetical protein DDB_G0281961 [Dictyostelium discoideum AX4]|uniref:Uncharacterized protein n=1 Tax=Dictyostelium discoideum TaxID=44689 RepID=Q54T77_DICDI|nr:hypothetical protein DDB_G0281961 [Dictyostelium discoideum AX4]EAL66402.1 hypothetical protein DDB_G0281961 [Dictyostelium discoideum AX4]|eukprot:XP_640374.1 hypothetical protein DDB_G0281961 [Dictyostelium discoideum AX4]
MKFSFKSIFLFITFICLLSIVFANNQVTPEEASIVFPTNEDLQNEESILESDLVGKMNTDVCAGKNQVTCLVFEFAQIKCYWDLKKGKCLRIYP